MYYNLVGDLRIRNGPVNTADPLIQLSKNDYTPRSALMAAPIVFQTRVTPSANCPYSYSRKWLLQQHFEVVNSTCSNPFACSNDILQRPELTMSCTGDLVTNGTEFGLDPIEFQGVIGFADILYSITDTDYVFREDSVTSTSSFFDSLTQAISLILVFFSPQYGVTSVLTFSADLSGPNPANIAVDLQHYEILEGSSLVKFIVIECLLLVTVISMSIDIVFDLRRLWSQMRGRSVPIVAAWQISPPTLLGQIGKVLADAVTILLVIVSGALRTWLKIDSNAQTERIVGGLASIPWHSSAVLMTDKKR